MLRILFSLSVSLRTIRSSTIRILSHKHSLPLTSAITFQRFTAVCNFPLVSLLAHFPGDPAMLFDSMPFSRWCIHTQVLYALDAKVDSVISLAQSVAEEGEGWWAELAQRPPVKTAVAAYQRAHDTVVATAVYSKCAQKPSSIIVAAWLPNFSCCLTASM